MIKNNNNNKLLFLIPPPILCLKRKKKKKTRFHVSNTIFGFFRESSIQICIIIIMFNVEDILICSSKPIYRLLFEMYRS